MPDKDKVVRQMDIETNSYVEGLSRKQTFLLPKTIEEYVQTDNPVRFIDAYVNTLDMEKLGFTHSTPQDLGRPSYNPKDLLQTLPLRRPKPHPLKQKTRT
jgi:transposase